MMKEKRCAGCHNSFMPDNPNHFLCSECAKKAFVDHVCPICGKRIYDNKPVCFACRRTQRRRAEKEIEKLRDKKDERDMKFKVEELSSPGQKKVNTVRCNHKYTDGRQCSNRSMIGSYYCHRHQV